STGERRVTSGGACQGSKGVVRSTPEWLNQLFAELMSRVGTLAPWFRANSPTTESAFLFQGRAKTPSANSDGLGRYKKEGSNGRHSRVPGAVSWGMGRILYCHGLGV